MMGSEAKTKTSFRAKLPLFSVPQMLSPEHSGMLTPPLQTSVSVPFGWEEQPGKPRVCTALITIPMQKALELPPRLHLLEYYSKIITKSPFPTTFRGAPYVGKTVNSSPSFRLTTNNQDSFQLFLDNHKRSGKNKGRRLLGSWGQNKQKLATSVCSSYPVDDDESCSGTNVKMPNFSTKLRSSSTFSHSKSHFWATMYEGFKQAITWKSRKSKKQVLTNKGLP